MLNHTEDKKRKILENVWIRLIILLGSAAIFLVICGFLKGILISLFLAFTVAYIFDPVVDFIEGRKMAFPQIRIRRSFAICILLFGITLISVGLLTYAIPKTANGIQQVGNTLKQRFPEFRSNIEKLIGRYGNNEISLFLKDKLGIVNNDTETLTDDGLAANRNKTHEIEQLSVHDDKSVGAKRKIDSASSREQMSATLANLKKYSPQALKFVAGIAKNVFKSAFGFFGLIINFFIFSIVTIYLLKDFDRITANVYDLIPISRRDKASAIFSRIDVNLKGFFRGQITVCVILSLIYSIGLTIVGVPLSFVLGFIAGFGNVIPYVGTIIGLGLTMTIAFFQFHDIQHIVFVVAVFGIGQFLEGTLITPKIIGSKLGLSPVIVIVSILIWSQLLGFLGLLLAVPFTSVAKVLIDEGIARYKGSSIYKRLSK